jgi:hypothetical protein
MRLTSVMFVAAHIRRCQSEGASAVVVRHGADDAGAIFFVVDRLDNTVDLYGSAPQTVFMDRERTGDRLFQRLTDRADAGAVDERLKREMRFDPDIWVVAIEDRDGRSFLDVVSS